MVPSGRTSSTCHAARFDAARTAGYVKAVKHAFLLFLPEAVGPDRVERGVGHRRGVSRFKRSRTSMYRPSLQADMTGLAD